VGGGDFCIARCGSGPRVHFSSESNLAEMRSSNRASLPDMAERSNSGELGTA
jgi:hypothetical protein